MTGEGIAPAVLNGGRRLRALAAEQRHAPGRVVAVQPIVVDRQRVLEVLHRVVPPAAKAARRVESCLLVRASVHNCQCKLLDSDLCLIRCVSCYVLARTSLDGNRETKGHAGHRCSIVCSHCNWT